MKVGDVFILKSPVSFGAVDANGEAIAGLSFEIQEVVLVAFTGNGGSGQTVFLSPVINADAGILQGALQIFPFKE